MRFKDFINLDETGTSTADIAGFSRICIPMTRRQWPTDKKKPYRVPQVEESKKEED